MTTGTDSCESRLDPKDGGITMEKIDYKKIEDIRLENVLYADTSPIGYEMDRTILLDTMDSSSNYIIVTGSHCSCYNFDETEWEALQYTQEELTILAKDKTSSLDDDLREFILKYFDSKGV